jgi:hypothetical protein
VVSAHFRVLSTFNVRLHPGYGGSVLVPVNIISCILMSSCRRIKDLEMCLVLIV